MNARTAVLPVFEAGRAILLAQETLGIEAAAVMAVRQRLGPAFAQAVERMLLLSGRVVVMGMGKSGHIGRKIAATLASTAASLTASSSTRPTCTTTTGLRFHCAGGPTL